MKITNAETRENLDFGISVEMGDLGETIPSELDNVYSDNSFSEKPQVVYRTFRSDDLSEPLLEVDLEIKSISFNKTGCKFEAKAPALNVSSTGELYKLSRFPMLRGFL